jgi:hypothetical protein
MNGIHEVTGSIPVWSTILRSPASVGELRLGEPSEFTSPTREGCRAEAAEPRRQATSFARLHPWASFGSVNQASSRHRHAKDAAPKRRSREGRLPACKSSHATQTP